MPSRTRRMSSEDDTALMTAYTVSAASGAGSSCAARPPTARNVSMPFATRDTLPRPRAPVNRPDVPTGHPEPLKGGRRCHCPRRGAWDRPRTETVPEEVRDADVRHLRPGWTDASAGRGLAGAGLRRPRRAVLLLDRRP